MSKKPRRLRSDSVMRKLTRETRLSKSSLILPFFVCDGRGVDAKIDSLEGHRYYSVDNIVDGVKEAEGFGINSIILFGVPNKKDPFATGAYDEFGAVQMAVREIKKHCKNIQVITDVCLCEYTSHGHCTVFEDDKMDEKTTLDILVKIAVSHAKAGADIVAPSDMMDGRVGVIRKALDENGFEDRAILSYSAKYSSSFYGPFRTAAKSEPKFGDRKSYQMDYHNRREAQKEVKLDIEEGADIVMVKPALSYLDIIADTKKNTDLPVCAYSVSGEYAMIKAAAKSGLIDEYGMMCETAVSIFRAGADMLITYYAKELALAIDKGDIG